MYQFGTYNKVLFVSAALAVVIAMLAWRRRGSPGAWMLVVLELLAAQWCVAVSFEAAGTTEDLKWLWSKIAYTGTLGTPLFFFYFALSFGQFAAAGRRKILALAGVVPLVTLLLATTNEWHHWVWTGVTIDPVTLVARYEHGPWFWVLVVHTYSLIVVGIAALAAAAFRFQSAYRWQLVFLILAATVCLAGNVMYVFNLSPVPGRDWTPVTFLLSGTFLLFAMKRHGMLDLVPVARARLVDTMADGVLVADLDARVADANPSMLAIAAITRHGLIGRPVAEVLPQWRPLPHGMTDGDDWCEEVELEVDGATRSYEVNASALRDSRGNPKAMLYVFRDVTKRKRLEEERARLIGELQDALAEVRTLSGLLPICSSCKKIRDDTGYWHSVEVYFETHADASFTHSVCPECIKTLYPDMGDKVP